MRRIVLTPERFRSLLRELKWTKDDLARTQRTLDEALCCLHDLRLSSARVRETSAVLSALLAARDRSEQRRLH